MTLRRSLGVALIASVALASPVLAQPVGGSNDRAPTSTSSPTGTLQKVHGDWRSAQLVGATVYNDQNDSVGTIDNLLVNSDGMIDQVVLSVGGFLGIGSKYVAVPFNQLKFERSRQIVTTVPPVGASSPPGSNGTPLREPNPAPPAVNPAPAQPNYYSIMLPDATKESLTSMPAFTYGG